MMHQDTERDKVNQGHLLVLEKQLVTAVVQLPDAGLQP
jgi:hypothetical protein